MLRGVRKRHEDLFWILGCEIKATITFSNKSH
jgi:hypothetical protein